MTTDAISSAAPAGATTATIGSAELAPPQPTGITPCVRPAAIPAPRKRKPYIPTGRPPGRPKGSVTKAASATTKPRAPPEPPAIKPAAMRIEDATRYIGVSESMIRKLIREGRLETVKLDACRLILVRSLDRLLESGT
jgi:hypothetical protein